MTNLRISLLTEIVLPKILWLTNFPQRAIYMIKFFYSLSLA